MHQPFKSQVSVSFRPSGMLDVSPLVFKADFLGALLSGAGPTLGVFDESPETLAPQIYAPFLWNRSCLWVAAQRVGFWQDYVSVTSTHLHVAFLPRFWRSCSPSYQVYFRKKNCCICSYRFGVSMGGGDFRVFLLCHLELPMSTTF